MTKPITYSETFHSIQGEGYFTGVPSTWLRFFLCNLQCDGFGQDDPTDKETYDLPYKNIDVKDITKIEDLPVWERGCDSSYSWSKKFKHLQHKSTPAELVDILVGRQQNEFNPEGRWKHPVSGETTHLCITGGEPMMKHAQKAVIDLWDEFRAKLAGEKPLWITWETNGTQALTPEFEEYFSNPGVCAANMFMSVSPKLFTVSGEKNKKAICPEIVATYDKMVTKNRRFGDRKQIPNGQLKFVLGPKAEQWEELDRVVKEFRAAGVDWPVWIMPVGATLEGQALCDGDVARMAQDRGYSVAARVHTYLYGNLIGV
jgi:7-carboxy-7-deazaguanine synthase